MACLNLQFTKNLTISILDQTIYSITIKPSTVDDQTYVCFQWPRLAQDLQLAGGGDRSVHRLWQTQCEATQYKKTFFECWNNLELDAVICPSYPITASPLGSVENLSGE